MKKLEKMLRDSEKNLSDFEKLIEGTKSLGFLLGLCQTFLMEFIEEHRNEPIFRVDVDKARNLMSRFKMERKIGKKLLEETADGNENPK